MSPAIEKMIMAQPKYQGLRQCQSSSRWQALRQILDELNDN